MEGSPDSTFDPIAAGYGLSQVSRLYGPGSITAWLLLTLSLVINTLYFPPSETPSEQSSRASRNLSARFTSPGILWFLPLGALDNILSLPASLHRFRGSRLDLVVLIRIAFFAFPLVAALDLLRNLDAYTTDPGLPALFDAPFLVVNLAKAGCFLVLLAEMGNKLFFTPTGQARRSLSEPSPLYPLALVFFQGVGFWAQMRAKGAERREYIAALTPVPDMVWVWAFGQPASPAAFVARYEAYLHDDAPDPRSALWSPFWVRKMTDQSAGETLAWIFVAQVGIQAVFGVLRLALMIWDGEVKVEVIAEWASKSLLSSFGDWASVLGFYETASTVMFVGGRGWGEGLAPRSMSGWRDLDQMATLGIGGVLPVVWSVGSVVARHHAVKLELERKDASLGRVSTGKLEQGLGPVK